MHSMISVFLIAFVARALCEDAEDAISIGDVMEYTPAVTAQWDEHIQAMHWLHEGHRAVVYSQLEAVHRNSDVPVTELKLIDIACGEGAYVRALADRFGYDTIVGVDKSYSQLEIARNRTNDSVSRTNIEFYQMDVPADILSDADVAAIGGPFDIALANWLLFHADSKPMLLDMMRWIERVLKPGGTLIGWTVGIDDFRDADNGVVKDPKFRMESHFAGDGEPSEGFVLQKEGAMEYYGSVWSFNTYQTLFEIADFDGVHFLDNHEYMIRERSIGAGDEADVDCGVATEHARSIKEMQMFDEIILWKGCILKVLRTTKRN